MPEDPTPVVPHLCPACFAKEIDPIMLHYDEQDREYYCVHCCYSGTREEVEAFGRDHLRHKYGVNFRFSSD